jgi:hypothetical protein
VTDADAAGAEKERRGAGFFSAWTHQYPVSAPEIRGSVWRKAISLGTILQHTLHVHLNNVGTFDLGIRKVEVFQLCQLFLTVSPTSFNFKLLLLAPFFEDSSEDESSPAAAQGPQTLKGPRLFGV